MRQVADYDLIICGAGAAGLSLALRLVRSPLRDRSILIIDRNAKDRNDRTWAFWTSGPTFFDEIVYRSWEQLHIVGENLDRRIDLHGYRYQVIRGIDFYRFARRELTAHPNVTFMQGVVERIDDGTDAACVTVNGQTLNGQWVFDSTRPHTDVRGFGDSGRLSYHHLRLYFKGWEIETAQPVFNPRAATLMDFRTPQGNATRFFYVLPFSERRALVEYTVFSAEEHRRVDTDQALKAYLKNTLRIAGGARSEHAHVRHTGMPPSSFDDAPDNGGYRIVSEERGVIPVTDQPCPRRIGRHVMTIGTPGGRVKPTTGYAFMRIQKDSEAIMRSLLENGHPFAVPGDSRRYQLYDSMMLHIMAHHGEQVKPIFTRMFRRNPIHRILRFLDEAGSIWENLRLILTLPPRVFLQALFRIAGQRFLAQTRKSSPGWPSRQYQPYAHDQQQP